MDISSAGQLGAAIRTHRRREGLTQVELAARAGIASRTLIEIERGHPHGEVGRVLAVLRALNLAITLTPVKSDRESGDLLDLAGQDL